MKEPTRNGDADDALVRVLFASERAVVGDGLVAGDVVEAVLDEVRVLHAGQDEGGLFAGQLGLHGGEDGVGRGFCAFVTCRSLRMWRAQGQECGRRQCSEAVISEPPLL